MLFCQTGTFLEGAKERLSSANIQSRQSHPCYFCFLSAHKAVSFPDGCLCRFYPINLIHAASSTMSAIISKAI
jgi:hypothetical protein